MAIPLLLALAACSGGGSGTVAGPTNPAPTPTPTPTPGPGPATVTYLHNFGISRLGSPDGGNPENPLIQASDGNFYGTTAAGGSTGCTVGCGVIYKVAPGGGETLLHIFDASGAEGSRASGALIQGSDGALYGVTSSGGAHDAGTLYRVTLGGDFSVLYSFGASPTDGLSPTGALVQGSDGSFYGATSSGGANHCFQIPQGGGNCGTIFKLSPGGAATILYSFGTSQSDGVTPNGSLVQGTDGNFYGTTLNGGANACSNSGATNNCGTAFRITPGGQMTILYSFGASPADVIAPQGGLLLGRDGAFYGRSASGGGGTCGNPFGCGTIFKMTASGAVTIVYAFATTGGGALGPRGDGYGPSSLIQAADGNFYGTTGSGGATPADLNGTVFKLTPGGVKTILYSFGPLNTDPSNPWGLIQGRDGAFYGLTRYSGNLGATGNQSGTGTVFKLVP